VVRLAAYDECGLKPEPVGPTFSVGFALAQRGGHGPAAGHERLRGSRVAAPSGRSRLLEGPFSVDREVDGYRHAPWGTLYRPKYFHGGVAVHGFTDVPAYRPHTAASG
jgi:hypothetical protein